MARSSKAKTGAAGGATKSPTAEHEKDLALVRQLLELLDGSTAMAIEITRGGATYKVSRGVGSVPQLIPPLAHLAPHANAGAAAPAAAGAPQAAQPSAPAPVAPPSNLIDIKSPMVGTFYRSPEPGAEPYVKAGSRVSPGQTLCIIEAMKIMNELESEVSGVIREILVDDATPVEFGQVLFRVESNV
jgi:acetyl-CoA carboxylase biotin carboxyl carrier protein